MKGKTSKELKKELKKYVLQNADELVIELKKRKKSGYITSNEDKLCMS